jgi:hypothetical protein
MLSRPARSGNSVNPLVLIDFLHLPSHSFGFDFTAKTDFARYHDVGIRHDRTTNWRMFRGR